MALRTPKLLTLAALLVAATGCEDELAAPDDGGVYSDASAANATIQGFVWDPEAYWLAFAACGQNCMLPPLLLSFSPLYQMAAVPNAVVGLFDPLQPTMPLAYPGAGPTATNGGYNITGVPIRSNPPFFPLVALVQPGPGSDGGAPQVGYLPTLTMKPIATGKSTLCIDQSTLVASDSGVLEAVAKHLTATGKATTVADLLDPTKSGGVVIWWLWIPGNGLRVPAFGTGMTADAGTTFNISWLPPGVGPPFITAIQSKRGFYVNSIGPMAPGAAPGLTVTVMPPLAGPPPSVTFTAVDPVTDMASGRPFMFPKLSGIQVAPGAVMFGELQALAPGASGAPPDWVCLP